MPCLCLLLEKKICSDSTNFGEIPLHITVRWSRDLAVMVRVQHSVLLNILDHLGSVMRDAVDHNGLISLHHGTLGQSPLDLARLTRTRE